MNLLLFFRGLLKPWFIISSAVYLSNRFLIASTGISFLDHYLNDLLAVPIVLQLTQVVMALIYRYPYFQITTFQIVITVIYFSVFFELFLPLYSPIFHGDWLDVLCYALGGIFFRLILSPNQSIQP